MENEEFEFLEKVKEGNLRLGILTERRRILKELSEAKLFWDDIEKVIEIISPKEN